VKNSAVKTWSAVHRVVYRLSRGIVGSRLVGNDMLLLTTVGRKTRQAHTVPLLYLESGEDLLVIASYGGRDRHPEWYLNLLAHPEATVQIRGSRLGLRARTADAEERRSWWPRVVEAYDEYATYQTRTDREIPIVILERVAPDPGH